MITVTNIRNIDHTAYDEVWAIVRSLKHPRMMKSTFQSCPLPGICLDNICQLRNTGRWKTEALQGIYVPTFLKEMLTATARKKFNELVWQDRQGRRIALVCFCPNEATYHRSIITGILQHVEIPVQGVKGDYSQYGRHHEQLTRH